MLENERLADFEEELMFLERLSEFLRNRTDYLCMARQPTLADLVVMPTACRWVCRDDDTPLVTLLRALAATSGDPLDYLDHREQLATAQAVLKQVQQAGQGQGRGHRWWGLLHRDMCDILRGKLTQLPTDGTLSPPRIALYQDLVDGLRWLKQMAQKNASGGLPGDSLASLKSANLID
jgi:hypothetical protein